MDLVAQLELAFWYWSRYPRLKKRRGIYTPPEILAVGENRGRIIRVKWPPDYPATRNNPAVDEISAPNNPAESRESRQATRFGPW